MECIFLFLFLFLTLLRRQEHQAGALTIREECFGHTLCIVYIATMQGFLTGHLAL